MAKHPIQPLEIDQVGTVRFKENKIVTYLLDHGGIDLNQIGQLEFSQEDREQFAQLIGYSHSAAGDLSYFSDATWVSAYDMHTCEKTELQARLDNAESNIRMIKSALREPVAALFRLHPSELNKDED